MLTATGPKYAAAKSLPKFSTKVIGGKTYNFVTTGIAWDLYDLIDKGSIAFHNNKLVQGNWWYNMDPSNAEWKALVPRLKALAAVVAHWKFTDLYVLIAEGSASVRMPIPETTQARTTMIELGQQTQAGIYYRSVKVPADLKAFRQAMLDYGNARRQRSGFPQEQWINNRH